MRRPGRAVRVLAAALALASLGAWLSLAPADPALYPARGAGVRVAVLDHGWHSGIAIGQAELRAATVRIARENPDLAERLRWLAALFPSAEWLEIGWGDADFYRVTPGIGDVDPWLGLRALLWPTPSVLQVVPGFGAVAAAFPRSQVVELELSEAGFERLAAALAATAPPAGPRPPRGPSLYGGGAFYPAVPSYHLFRTCNHWVSTLLRAAGVPSSPLPSTFSDGLMAELRWRAV
jgi:Protein of unknown function (DUF2459)